MALRKKRKKKTTPSLQIQLHHFAKSSYNTTETAKNFFSCNIVPIFVHDSVSLLNYKILFWGPPLPCPPWEINLHIFCSIKNVYQKLELCCLWLPSSGHTSHLQVVFQPQFSRHCHWRSLCCPVLWNHIPQWPWKSGHQIYCQALVRSPKVKTKRSLSINPMYPINPNF